MYNLFITIAVILFCVLIVLYLFNIKKNDDVKPSSSYYIDDFEYNDSDEFLDNGDDNLCRSKTINNPFVNTQFVYDNTNYVSACNADENDIIHSPHSIDIEKIKMPVSSVYGIDMAERVFYTTPVTQIPNQQIEAAKWIYERYINPVCHYETTPKINKCNWYSNNNYDPKITNYY